MRECEGIMWVCECVDVSKHVPCVHVHGLHMHTYADASHMFL